MSHYLSTKELRKKTEGQLGKLLAERRERLRQLKFQIAAKQVKNHRELRFVRKEIARILTVLNELRIKNQQVKK